VCWTTHVCLKELCKFAAEAFRESLAVVFSQIFFGKQSYGGRQQINLDKPMCLTASFDADKSAMCLTLHPQEAEHADGK
jgi:hypothetical protein